MKLIRNLAVIALGITTLTSCDAINDDHGPCPETPAVTLRFVYDYNLLYANALPSQVHCLGAYIFNSAGVLVKEHHEIDPTNIKDENWRLKIEDLAPGNYQVLAYGGMECENTSFHHLKPFVIGETTMREVQVRLSDRCHGEDAENNKRNLHDHFYGVQPFTMPGEGSASETVHMMKNTNTVHVTLQHVDGSEINCDDFRFEITDDNNEFDYNNTLRPTGEILYRPFEKSTTSTGSKGDDEDNLFYAATAHFKLSRLVPNKESVTTLSVKKMEDNEEVLRLPLLNYLCLTNNYGMSNQEYLDRKYDYNMVVFLKDDDSTWAQIQIIVEDWYVRVDNIEE